MHVSLIKWIKDCCHPGPHLQSIHEPSTKTTIRTQNTQARINKREVSRLNDTLLERQVSGVGKIMLEEVTVTIEHGALLPACLYKDGQSKKTTD